MKAKRHSTERFLELLRLTGENEVKVIETIKALSDVKINATDEQLDEWCSRWGDVKNFHNTPGDFTNEEAVEALKELIANWKLQLANFGATPILILNYKF